MSKNLNDRAPEWAAALDAHLDHRVMGGGSGRSLLQNRFLQRLQECEDSQTPRPRTTTAYATCAGAILGGLLLAQNEAPPPVVRDERFH